ncbi:MAG: hypothetical protein HQK72_13655 [Desulfamplus sp.]|nr:hypothetical protein [Desulfamplus sp.]
MVSPPNPEFNCSSEATSFLTQGEKVSSYINELYNHYSLEGVNMPCTHEMFLKDHFPPVFLCQFMLGKEKGFQEGKKKGEFIGKIQLLQQILKQTESIKTELLAKNISELQSLYDSLEKEWLKVQN